MDTSLDYYALLGINRSATPEEVKRAYRKAVFRYHPDRNPGDDEAAEKFKQVLQGYEILSDTKKRSAYDEVTSPANGEEEVEEKEPNQEKSANFSENLGSGFNFSQKFKHKLDPEPKCPSCSVVGTDHIVSRKGGAASSRGKQFVLSPFNIILCDSCGHVYGITPSAT